jgi:DNA polymerase-3 subunit delta
MPDAADKANSPLWIICGEDEFTVKRRARQCHRQWLSELPDADQEIIDGNAANSGEALRAIAKLREALQTLPFFGTGKIVWFQNCNFFGEERTATSQAVTEALSGLAAELKGFVWMDVRLLISSGKIDKRLTFYKTIEKLGNIELYSGWSLDDRDWVGQAEGWARKELNAAQKAISQEALAQLVTHAGATTRLLSNEIEKLALYTGERKRIELEDVDAIVTRQKQAKAFALSDALGDRDVPKMMKTLDETLWEIRSDNQKSSLGILYGLIAKIRTLLFLSELIRAGHINPNVDMNRFTAQLQRIPPGTFPEDKKLNPLLMHPYILYKALGQAGRYTQRELIKAMELLLECNLKLIYSNLDEGLVLQQTLLKIAGGSAPSKA